MEMPDRSRLEFLDGLRTLAALWVLLGHIRLFAVGWDGLPGVSGWLLDVPLYMHLGVVVFLVLSGFCLMQPAAQAPLPRFFAARAARILPPYFGALALILLLNAWLPLVAWGRHPAGLTDTLPPQVWWTNLLLLQDVFPQYNIINGPFWSVACEWHLYFIFPVLALVLRRWGVAALVGGAGLLALALTWGSDAHGPFAFFGEALYLPQPPYFLFLLACGMAAAAAARKAWPLWPLALVLGAAFVWLQWEYPIRDFATMQARARMDSVIDPVAGALAATLIAMLARQSPRHWVRRCLEQRWLVSTARYSYSLYLIHIPLLAILHQQVGGSGLRSYAMLALLGIPLCLLAARGFGAVFERRFNWRALAGGWWRRGTSAGPG